MIRLGSLFSGIGGLDLGLEQALRDGGFDCETTWQCEADEWCRGILARHWPDALRYDDVRVVGADAPRVDILCGGFPCQDVSVAGKGAGLAGERSGLWFEFARIARVLRPRIVVVENVAALAFRGLGTVLGDLSEAGYDAVWFDLRASDVGAPHRRERLFIVAWRRDVGDGAGARREGITRDIGADEGRVSGVAAGAGEDVADGFGVDVQRRRSPRGVARASGAAQGETQERQRRGDAARGGGEAIAVADADSGRREQQRERGVLDGEQSALRHDADGCDGESAGVGLADPYGDGLEGVPSNRFMGRERSSESGLDDGDGRDSHRITQPRVGRAAHGLPRGLDLTAHRWPVGPGEAQPVEEPPRVTQERTQRRQRLKALGNAVVPQCGYVVGCVVAQILRTEAA